MMRSGDDGFSLLETIVALAILSVVAVAFTTGMSTGWRGIAAAESDMKALSVAQNELERAGVEWPLASGSRQGVSPEGLSYSVIVAPAVTGQTGSPTSGAYWVTVEVQGNGVRRPVRLQTLRTERTR